MDRVAQEVMDRVVSWSRKWRLELNVSKCECCLFTTNTQERRWRPTMQIGDQAIRYAENPTFLGVTYESQLTFGPHMSRVRRKMVSRFGVPGRLGGTDWEWGSTMVYAHGLPRNPGEYEAPAWAPGISRTSQENLERAQL